MTHNNNNNNNGSSEYKILIDIPSNEPALGYAEYARALGDIINNSSPQFAVGIFGGWGSGKTTLMQELQKKIDDEKAICVEFSAWRYEKEDHLIIPLLATIKDAIESWAKAQIELQIQEKAITTAKTITSVITSLVAGLNIKFGIPKAMEISFDANKALERAAKEASQQDEPPDEHLSSIYYTCFKALRTGFDNFLGKNSKRRIVIFVDDLDRCLPEGVIQVLESMKLFFDLHGFVFVVGLDQQVVEWCIDNAYAQMRKQTDGGKPEYQIRGSDYIKKIFQVPFTLFPVSISQIDGFLNTLISENELCDLQANEIRGIIRPHLNYVVEDTGVNPREIKRFINAYTLNMKIKPNLQPNAVLSLRTITFRQEWQSIQEALYVYGEIFLDALNRQVNGEAGALSSLHRDLGSIPDSFIMYVSPGAPGNALLNARPLDEYIRSGFATSSSGDPMLLDSIRDIGKQRSALDKAVTEQGLEESVKRFREFINKLESQLIKRTKMVESKNPYIDAANRAISELQSHFDEGPKVYNDPNKISEWRTSIENHVSVIISALVKLYQAGES